jgi:hypothetical protein
MRRTRYDAEYERVRREAGLPPPEFPCEPEPRQPAAPIDLGRVDAAHADFKARMAALSDHERAAAAVRKVEADALSKRANLSVLVTEFARAGVRPPCVNQAGEPTVSLPTLLWLGWTIADRDDGKVLVRPVAAPAQRRTREDYERERGMGT